MRPLTLALAIFTTMLTGCDSATEPVTTTPAAGSGSGGGEGEHDQEGLYFDLSGENTQVLFTGTKKSGDNHSGGFKTLTGKIHTADQQIKSINVVIETESLFADVDKLAGHLKNEDFFSVKEFPQLKFASTKIEGDADITVTGNLTMHGETAEISFPATFGTNGADVTLNAEFKVDRTKFGMNYTGQPNDPINAEVDIKVIVGEPAAPADADAETKEPADKQQSETN